MSLVFLKDNVKTGSQKDKGEGQFMKGLIGHWEYLAFYPK